MELSLKPIKPKKVSDQVFDQLRELIYRSQVKPGEQLLPERELAKALGVSRTTVRNAINKLVTIGLLEHRQGQGTFVRSPEQLDKNPLAAAMEAQEASMEDLLEVRLGLECNAAALAAARADDKDLKLLEDSLKEMRKEVTAGGHGTSADVSFHMAIAYATKNPLHVMIMRTFYDLLFFGIQKSLQHLYEKPSYRTEILKHHRCILEAIQHRDAEQAFQSMKQHISFVLSFYREQQ